ncbi:MAG: hypothetical protein N3F63_01020 [Thermoplasmata archaeon]|nr:hypothetical protein [Thermoplasmata archaeon]
MALQVVTIAKKVPVEEPEDQEVFKFPEFNEIEFVKKEMRDTKGALLVVLTGIIFAVISFLLTVAQQPGIGLLVGLVGMGSIKYILNALKVDTSEYKIKNWLGHIGSYFFIWLAIWILLMNAPFSDFAKPTIKDVKVYAETGGNNTQCEIRYYGEEAKVIVKNTSAITRIVITAKITDNAALKTVRLVDRDGNEVASYQLVNQSYEWKILNSFRAGDVVKLGITASDNAGNWNRFSMELDFQ